MNPGTGDPVFDVVWSCVTLAVFVASFRRVRLLDGKSIVVSALIALLSACFVPFWLFVWAINRARIAREWDDWRVAKSRASVPLA